MSGLACECVSKFEAEWRDANEPIEEEMSAQSGTNHDKANHIKSLVDNSHRATRCTRVTLPSLIAVVRQIKKQSLHIDADEQHGKITRSPLS